MKIGIIGCGYVLDHYMDTLHYHPELTVVGVTDLIRSRADIISEYYKVPVFDTTEELINSPDVEIVVNLTEPENHFDLSLASLNAGKHVYSEKPLAIEFDQAQKLVQLADEKGLLISSAPCSLYGSTAQTIWKAIAEGAIGKPRVIYAELDDNPIYLMHPENWRNDRGIPWPYLNEYKTGCTLEHAAYYLTWLVAIFGPAKSVTAFSSCLVPEKSTVQIDTPDLSVACITFDSGVVARLTCSIVAPYDHRIQFVGDEGVLTCSECWHNNAPIYLERFNQLSLNARKSRTIRKSSALQAIFGVGGSKQKLISKPLPQLRFVLADLFNRKRTLLRTIVKLISKRELVCMDFFRGVSEMAKAIESGDRFLLSSDFVLHVTELTLVIQRGSEDETPYNLTTSFRPLETNSENFNPARYKNNTNTGFLSSFINKLIEKLHRH